MASRIKEESDYAECNKKKLKIVYFLESQYTFRPETKNVNSI